MCNHCSGLHVLAIDGSEHSRSLVKEILHSLGFQRQTSREAEDRLEALQNLAQASVDLAICGWRMEPKATLSDSIAVAKTTARGRLTIALTRADESGHTGHAVD